MATKQHRELEYAFLALTILSAVYVAYTIVTVRNGSAPAGGHPFGHWLGIIGTLLMVMTETLYSLRKRTRLLNRAGPVRSWLSFHIFTGIVGPFLVLMHTGLEFRGLAGATMMLTILIVLSGFVGRYLYSSVQRSGQLSTDNYAELVHRISQARQTIQQFERTHPARVLAINKHWLSEGSRQPAFVKSWQNFRLQQQLKSLESERLELVRELQQLVKRKQKLETDIERNESFQRLFSLWHLVHVPLGITLFVAIIIHVVATIFFRAGLFG